MARGLGPRLGLGRLLGLLLAGCIAILAGAAAPAPAPAAKGNNQVEKLSLDTFGAAVGDAAAGSGAVLLVFYAPWCRHCEALNPHLQQLVGEVSRDELTVAKIDATEERALATRFSIRAYPTLFFLIDGRVYPYHHPRTVEAFRGFLSQGHKEAQALSMLSSPFGPVGRARALVSTVGQRLVNLSEWMEKEYEIPKEIAVGLAVLATSFVAVILLVLFIWASLEYDKRKRD